MRNEKIEIRKKFNKDMNNDVKKNILVVDDSALMRRVICDIINASNEFEASDTARDGLEAYEKIKSGSFAAVLLDINMPRMNGLELLQKLQKENIRATVIVVSSLTTEDAKITMQALEYGAIDFLTKPTNIIEAKGEHFRKELTELVYSVLPRKKMKTSMTPASNIASAAKAAKAATANVAALVAGAAAANTSASANTAAAPVKKLPCKGGAGSKKLVAIASSTGGPRSLQSVIPLLEKNMDAPVLLVQHMPSGFTKSMAERLNELSRVEVREARDNDILKNGCVYVAPGGYHLEVVPVKGVGHKIHLSDAPPIGGLRPCANVMYKSLKRSTYDQIICVVLTGMGADGTEGIRELNRVKPIYVIAQDEPTCVVYGMPKAVAEAGLVDEVVPLANIPKRILNQVGEG